MQPRPDPDPHTVVVVPARPGPVASLPELGGRHDEVDEALDDLFGEPDQEGPGPADAVLLAGGTAAVVAGLVASLPGWVPVVGAGAVALGIVLPVRSLWRRADSARRTARVRAAVGDGRVLRSDHPELVRLLAAHDRLRDTAAGLAPVPRARVEEVAHAALVEVASLLAGTVPVDAGEVAYVAERTEALRRLGDVAAAPGVGDGDTDRRRAVVEARREVEALAGGSSVDAAAGLADDLRGRAGG